jgi:chemoreceptor zinc-binding protein
MDFDQAIAAHSAWKRKLSEYLSSPNGSLRAAEAGADNRCELGKWIYGEGSTYSALPTFATLKHEHARFHKAVGAVIKKVDSGQPATAESELGSKSELSRASSAVVLAITTMKKQL